LYQQFAVTIAVSVLFSAFNALTLSPALAALLLKPKKESGRGPLGSFFRAFNKVFGSATNGYVGICRYLMRRGVLCLLILIPVLFATGWIGGKLPQGFVSTGDQGYVYANLQFPEAASLQRTTAACRKVSDILQSIPGVQSVTSIAGFSLLSDVNTTYSGFFFITLKPWEKRTSLQEHLRQIMANTDEALRKVPDGIA